MYSHVGSRALGKLLEKEDYVTANDRIQAYACTPQLSLQAPLWARSISQSTFSAASVSLSFSCP